MLSTVRRHAVVIALALLTAAAGMGLRPRQAAIVTLPPLAGLLAGSGWHMDTAYQPAGLAREWRLRDAHGHPALLFLEAAVRPQALLHWSGELGYEGAGYLVRQRGRQAISLGGKRAALISASIVQRLGDRWLVESAVVSRDGVAAPAPDDLLRAAWLMLRGPDGPYYLVRISVPIRDDAPAARNLTARLLSPVLRALQERVEAGA